MGGGGGLLGAMRITGGAARGLVLRVPQGLGVRPATDKLRQAVFNSLGAAVAGARVLDLFAGAGGYGLEALSRGAAEVVLVEAQPRVARALAENLAVLRRALGRPEAGRVATADAYTWSLAGTAAFDLLFADPPYAHWPARGQTLLRLADGWLGGGGMMVLEHPGACEPSWPGWETRRRWAGGRADPAATILARAAAAPPEAQLPQG